MLVLRLLHVLFGFFGLVVASPCLWRKLQNPSFSEVLKYGFPLFRVADGHFVTFHNMFHNASKIVPCDMRMLRRR